ncbi:MAG: site-specific integrase [Bryobacterales bacterium]|nr:site-specific integrase [Bryobacterales bacterium]
MGKPKRKPTPKTILRLPDLEQSKTAVLNSLTSPSSRRSYDHAIREFTDWYCSEPRLAFNKTVVTRYRIFLEQAHYAASTINLRLAAVRRLAYEAPDADLLSPDLAAGIRRVKGVRKHGVRLGNWLTIEQGQTLLRTFDRNTLRGKRNYAMVAVLLGCGLRRAELSSAKVEDLQRREEHWVFADLIGKGGHVRTVPVPDWVGSAIQAWLAAAAVTAGPMFRAINKASQVATHGFSPKVIWSVVTTACSECGLPGVAPHDLRRTCARLCHDSGGEIEQIQYLLGHESVQTTERYIGCKQRLRNAVNDRIGLEA